MLDALRRAGNSKYILLVFGVIILVFIFWGAGPTGKSGDEGAVATVDGDTVTVREYREQYKRQTEYYKGLFRGQFDDEMARRMDLKHRALDIAINRRLALAAAEKAGVRAPEEEVRQAILSMPEFQKDGRFDQQTYFAVLKSNRIKPPDFEKAMGQDLIFTKMRSQAMKDVKVTDDDVHAAYARERRKHNLSFAAFDPARFRGAVKGSDEEAAEYFKANSSDFVVPARVRVFYAWADVPEFTRSAVVSDEDVKRYYEGDLKRFETAPEARARHILVRPDGSAPDREAARKAAREKAEGLLKRVRAGEKFADVARKHSEDPGSASRGGDLGYFKKGAMVKEFEEAAFALKKGEVSGVVETGFGFHIIMIEDRKEGGARPLKEVAPAIRAQLQRDRGYVNARDAAARLEKAFRAAASEEELKKAVMAEKGVRYGSTGLVSEREARANPFDDNGLRSAVFSLKAGETVAGVEARQGVYVAKAVERTEAQVPEFKAVEAAVKERVAARKAREEAKRAAEELLKKSASGEDFNALLKAAGLKAEETGPFTRGQGSMPKTGIPLNDNQGVFDLDGKSPYLNRVIESGGRYYVLKFKGAVEADMKGFDAAKEGVKARLLNDRQEEALDKWLRELRGSAKIKVYEDRL